MSLPFLPGYTFSDNKRSNTRSQSFNFRNGVPVHDGPARPAATANVDLPIGVTWKTASGETPPTWLAFEKKTLKFKAFFEEIIPESREQKRIRRCNIYYYLEDGTLMIDEPKKENSGLPQGVLVRRHRAQKENGEVFKWDDFNIGKDIRVFGITYHIADCDHYTTDFYKTAGKPLNESERRPEDPYTEKRTKMLESMRPVRQGKTGPDPLRRFLDNDGKVLRFFCLWEDRTSARGELRQFVLMYFLADDTLQVNESLPSNSGRDPFPVFAKRQTPPKDFAGLESLVIGNTVTIFNRKLMIYAVDVYTQEYYRDNFGITDFTPIHIQQEQKSSPSKAIPKYNGFGTEEDSLISCLMLVPKAPKKDIQKLIENDRKVLQFSARIESKKPEDQEREFVVTYFLADDTISVFEPPQRNSGLPGGKFLERKRLKKPSERALPLAAKTRTLQSISPSLSRPATSTFGRTTSPSPLSPTRFSNTSSLSPPSSPGGSSSPSSADDMYYNVADMYIGAVIEVFKHKFTLQSASDYALQYMEANTNIFPFADANRVARKLAEAVADNASKAADWFAEQDPDAKGYISMEGFRKVLRQVCPDAVEQEFVTVGRLYDKDGDGKISYAEFYHNAVDY